jgi:hypothetical protein
MVRGRRAKEQAAIDRLGPQGDQNPLVPQERLGKKVLIHICKDRTLTYRTRDEPIFNGVALPIYSVDSKEEAEGLILMTCKAQYKEHPLLPGQTWYKLFPGFEYEPIQLEDLPRLSDHLAKAYEFRKGK